MSNGRTLELNENEATLTTSVPNGKVLVDGLGVGDVGNIVLRDRQHLSQDGLIVIVVAMDSSTGELYLSQMLYQEDLYMLENLKT